MAVTTLKCAETRKQNCFLNYLYNILYIFMTFWIVYLKVHVELIINRNKILKVLKKPILVEGFFGCCYLSKMLKSFESLPLPSFCAHCFCRRGFMQGGEEC